MPRKRSIKYEDARLQAFFISELKKLKVRHSIAADGAVLYWMRDNDGINAAAQTVRDRQFRWYFIYWDFDAGTTEFRRLLDEARLKYVIELHHDGTWFLLPRAEKLVHEELSNVAFDNALVLQAAVDRQRKKRTRRRPARSRMSS